MTPHEHFITFASTLPAQDQQVITDCLSSLSADALPSALSIAAVVDGRGLACPLPLLKTKVALRGINDGQSLYVIATDPNSRADIAAFCQQSKLASGAPALALVVQGQSTMSHDPSAHAEQSDDQTHLSDSQAAQMHSGDAANSDTLFHFIITKTDSN